MEKKSRSGTTAGRQVALLEKCIFRGEVESMTYTKIEGQLSFIITKKEHLVSNKIALMEVRGGKETENMSERKSIWLK